MMKDFERIQHADDFRIRVYGKTQELLFKHALQGMFQSIEPIAPDCRKEHDRIVCDQLSSRRDFGINSSDINSLLVGFLSEALYLSSVHHEAYLDLTITKFIPTYIEGTFLGIPIITFEGGDIKAVTDHDLAITNTNGIWQTDIVFDV